MKDPFLEDCGGWTPAPDVLTRNKNYGFEGAYLWGRIRRLCQIGKGSYTISHEELGKRIGMSRRTVIKYLDRLIEDGYVEDLTPGVRNKAHAYSVKKGEDKILSGMQISHTESDLPIETPNPDALESDVGMRNLHSDDAEIAYLDKTGVQKLHTDYAKNAHPGMQNLHLNRESLETLKDTTPNGVGDKPPPEPDKPKKQLMGIFTTETGLKMPHRKSDVGFWWSSIREIYEIVDNDVGAGGDLIRRAVKKMRASGLTISSPNSIINICRALAAEKSVTRNGKSPHLSAEQLALAKQLDQELAQQTQWRNEQ